MAAHSIKTVQKIPVSIEEAWNFFSSPVNLQAITPADMSFKIISNHQDEKMYTGQVIEYNVCPILKIPMYWMTEITHVEELKYFVDVQRKGPYSFWHHQHHFKKIEGGVEMIDIVHYKNPLGFMGEAANFLFVKRQLKKIFEYRFNKTEEIFGKWEGQKLFIEII